MEQKLVQKSKEETLTLEQMEQKLQNYMGFAELMARRTGYALGRRETTKKMNTASKTVREKANDIRKVIKKGIPNWIEKANVKEFEKQMKALADASAAVSKKTKPFRDKIAPLTKAVKYIDNIAVPASLKLLNVKVQPRFSLSKFMKDELEKQKTKNKNN